MLCDDCIKKLASIASREAPRVLKVLKDKGQLKKKQIMTEAGLSYAVTQRVVEELEAKMFISYIEQGRSKLFYITDTGNRLLKLSKGVN